MTGKDELREFAIREGWKFAQDEQFSEQYVAWRTIEVQGSPFHLTLRFMGAHYRCPWLAKCFSDSGRVNHSLADYLFEVGSDFVLAAQRVLKAANELTTCCTRVAAMDVLHPLNREDMALLCEVLGVEAVGIGTNRAMDRILAASSLRTFAERR